MGRRVGIYAWVFKETPSHRVVSRKSIYCAATINNSTREIGWSDCCQQAVIDLDAAKGWAMKLAYELKAKP